MIFRGGKTVHLYLFRFPDTVEMERKKSLQGAFSLASGADVRGKHILLLDDILTTGATLSGCAAVLCQAGAERVDALVFASDHR